MLKYHIQTIELNANSPAIVFSNIPQIYDDLYIFLSGASPNITNFFMRFNSSSANYAYRRLVNSLGTVTSYDQTAYSGAVNIMVGESWSTNTSMPSNSTITIFDYSKSVFKTFSVDHISEANAGADSVIAGITGGTWADSSPVTSLTIGAATTGAIMAQYSSASLYGIKRGADGVTNGVATGGTVTTANGFTIHTFTSSGTFTANRNLEVDYLVVAGGGGGGASNTVGLGGGGGGGYLAGTSMPLAAGTSYAVTVGAGGAIDANGSNSTFMSLTAIGGGRGGDNDVAISGGSGGGAGLGVANGAPGTAGQGNSGGNMFTRGGYVAAGGGGGAAGIGGTGTTNNTPGNGGAGIVSSISGTAVGRSGGGGGGLYNEGSQGTGGTASDGGGAGGRIYGNGAARIDAIAGTANTGGGGGGGGGSAAGQNSSSGAGGSGIVIIRYPTPA